MNASTVLVLPLLIPLGTVALCAVLWSIPRWQAIVSMSGSVLLLVSSVILFNAVNKGTVLAVQFGAWAAPFGISFVADLMAAGLVMMTGIVAVVVSIQVISSDEFTARSRTRFHVLYHGLLLGVVGAFLTGDIFNLYVWFEVTVIASCGLLVLQRSIEQLDGGVIYAALNLVATTLLLLAIGLLYGLAGTLNMADLGGVLPQLKNQGLVQTLGVLLLVAFGAKAAIFPLFFWLPAAYSAASISVAAVFAALLTKVGVYALLRVFTLIFHEHAAAIGAVGVAVAALTMLTGVLGAAAQFDTRRILAFHSISQVGYMLIGLAIATPLALAGAIVFIVHHSFVKGSLFLLAGIIRRASGSFDVRSSGGLYPKETLLSILFLLQAMSLAGLPPLSGFWAKLMLIQASLQADRPILAFVALVVGLLTLYSMVKIWNEAFWKDGPESSHVTPPTWSRTTVRRRALLLAPSFLLVLLTVGMGLWIQPVADFAMRAAQQLETNAEYVDAVRLAQLEQTNDGILASQGAMNTSPRGMYP